MKICFYILMISLLTSCVNVEHSKDSVANPSVETETSTETDDVNTKPQIQFTDLQLESYLDSIGGLSAFSLAEKVSFNADSTFKNQIQMDKIISESDFSILKNAIKKKEGGDKVIDVRTAKNIFGEIQVDTIYLKQNKIPITKISFDKNENEFNEYAICLGYPDIGWDCVLYFFKHNRIIAKHNIFHRYGLELEHYKDSDGKTIIYYKENFGSGSGIWQFNFFFYKYYGNKLIPILNELENGNLQSGWWLRGYWLETFVTKTNPLTLKMVYYQELYNSSDTRLRIIDDSTIVQYLWDERTKTLIGNYGKTKISKQQTLTYFPAHNEILFINTYYKTLKAYLKDKMKRQLILNYLNKVKNHFEDN